MATTGMARHGRSVRPICPPSVEGAVPGQMAPHVRIGNPYSGCLWRWVGFTLLAGDTSGDTRGVPLRGVAVPSGCGGAGPRDLRPMEAGRGAASGPSGRTYD